jgi:hypothetical protein
VGGSRIARGPNEISTSAFVSGGRGARAAAFPSSGSRGLPSFLRLPLERETSTVLTYAAGPGDTRSLKAFPATPNSAIEATTSHLVLDEWAHTFDPEALWGAVEPTLAPRATSALITTARNAHDVVHEYYLRSEAGETTHTPVFVSALEWPDRTHD